MPHAADQLNNNVIWRAFNFVGEWLFNLGFGSSSADQRKDRTRSSYLKPKRGRRGRTYNRNPEQRNNNKRNKRSSFLNMDAPIDISSSSDIDFDLSDDDDDDEVMTISPPEPITRRVDTGRKLPQSIARGLPPQQPKPSSSGRGPSAGEPSWYRVHRSHAESGPSTSYGVGADSRSSNANGGGLQPKRYGESTRGSSSTFGRNTENEQQPFKRALPPTFQSSAGRAKQSSASENHGGNHSRDRGGYYHPVDLSVKDSQGYGKSSFIRGSDDDPLAFENNRLRMLPHTMTRGKPGYPAQHAGPSDPLYNLGGGEERVSVDERSMYQAVLQGLSQRIGELDLPSGLLSVPLLRHQKMALAWMVEKESIASHCLGGILADDQGLGKTISTIALIQKQRSLQMKSQSEEHGIHNAEALDLDDDGDETAKNTKDPSATKSELGEVCVDKAEPLDLVDTENGSMTTKSVTKMEDLDGSKRRSGASSSRQTFQRKRPAAGTLIVCPATVLRQWARELDDKVSEESKLSVLVYHGGNRTKSLTDLAKFDVVLTTYAIVSNEVPKLAMEDEDDVDQKAGDKFGLSSEFTNKKRKQPSKKGKKGKKLSESSLYDQAGALGKVSWFRVVLDEAQTIKNHRTVTARACSGLRAKRRWCLSGTPIQNSIDELYSYFRFLRHEVFSNYKDFCQKLKLPISRDPNMGYKKLQAILKTLLLRRTKDMLLDGEPIINLPPKKIEMKSVSFTKEERTFYEQLAAETRSQFKAYAAAGTVNQNYANILLMILRLRQACDHPLLVKGFQLNPARKRNLQKAKHLPKPLLVDLLNQLEASAGICLSCSDPAEDAVITICGHVFCYQCVADYVAGDDNFCPARRCKQQLSEDVLFSEATLTSCISGDYAGNLLDDNGNSSCSSILRNEYSSTKIKAVLEILKSHCKLKTPFIELDGTEDSDTENSAHNQVTVYKTGSSSSHGTVKTIIFSQWTRMLDLLEFSLGQNHIKYRRLDGSMSLPARDRAVREFSTDPKVTCMLMSLKAGNLGLNMVAACQVILLDLWWNPTTEDQAIDRAHRIGQTRAVTVYRITVKDTIEDRILALQEEKRKMVASAFGEDRVGGHATRLTIDDLNYIFLGSRTA